MHGNTKVKFSYRIFLRREAILDFERGRIRPYSAENLLRKKLWICPKADRISNDFSAIREDAIYRLGHNSVT